MEYYAATENYEAMQFVATCLELEDYVEWKKPEEEERKTLDHFTYLWCLK